MFPLLPHFSAVCYCHAFSFEIYAQNMLCYTFYRSYAYKHGYMGILVASFNGGQNSGATSSTSDIHGSVHRRLLSRNTNKMQLCNRIYYSKVYWRLNMFRCGTPLIIRSSKLYLQPLVYVPVWWPAVAKAEWEMDPSPTQLWQRPVTTWTYKPEAANTV